MDTVDKYLSDVYRYVMSSTPLNLVHEVDDRRGALLDAAVAVFARYGFRKTSMDEVARAAGVSRQGLYLLFSDKEELFRTAVAHKLTQQLEAATAALADDGQSIDARLIAACDEWSGRFIGMLGSDAADLMCASTSLAGATLSHFEMRFETALTVAIGASPLAGAGTSAGLSAVDVARTLHATMRGLKHTSKSREAFIAGVSVAVRVICAALNRVPLTRNQR